MANEIIPVSKKVAAEFHSFLAKNYQKKYGGDIANALSKTVDELNKICSSDEVTENPYLKILEKARFFQKTHGGTIIAALRLVHVEEAKS